MACNYTEKFTRTIGYGALFVLLTAAHAAIATEFDGNASAYGSTNAEQSESGASAHFSARASASIAADGSQDEPAPPNGGDVAIDGESTTVESGGEMLADTESEAEGAFNAAVTTTSDAVDEAEAGANEAIDAAVESSEDLVADAEDVSSELGDELGNSLDTSLSGDVAASVDAAIRDDVRSTVQDDIVTDVVRSLPLPGRE